jgi:hypothetical protein
MSILDSNEAEELAYDGGGECTDEQVSALDLGHDKEHEREFFDAILDSDEVINAVIAFHRAPTCLNGALIKMKTDYMLAYMTGELEE